jgi:ABC-type glycerol-3-phosphate transport system substrate-binding protein
MKLALALAVALAAAACSAPAAPSPTPSPTPTVAPTPTPQVIVEKVEVPGPTVEVAPEECLDAVMGLNDIVAAQGDLLGAYLDDKDPSIRALDTFIDLDAEAIFDDVAACIAKYPGESL